MTRSEHQAHADMLEYLSEQARERARWAAVLAKPAQTHRRQVRRSIFARLFGL